MVQLKMEAPQKEIPIGKVSGQTQNIVNFSYSPNPNILTFTYIKTVENTHSIIKKISPNVTFDILGSIWPHFSVSGQVSTLASLDRHELTHCELASWRVNATSGTIVWLEIGGWARRGQAFGLPKCHKRWPNHNVYSIQARAGFLLICFHEFKQD